MNQGVAIRTKHSEIFEVIVRPVLVHVMNDKYLCVLVVPAVLAGIHEVSSLHPISNGTAIRGAHIAVFSPDVTAFDGTVGYVSIFHPRRVTLEWFAADGANKVNAASLGNPFALFGTEECSVATKSDDREGFSADLACFLYAISGAPCRLAAPRTHLNGLCPVLRDNYLLFAYLAFSFNRSVSESLATRGAIFDFVPVRDLKRYFAVVACTEVSLYAA